MRSALRTAEETREPRRGTGAGTATGVGSFGTMRTLEQLKLNWRQPASRMLCGAGQPKLSLYRRGVIPAGSPICPFKAHFIRAFFRVQLSAPSNLQTQMSAMKHHLTLAYYATRQLARPAAAIARKLRAGIRDAPGVHR